MSATATLRYRFDDMRRFAAALGTAAGLNPARALALASHLLWYDAAGASKLGIETLPSWLEAIRAGQMDAAASGRVVAERTGLAVFDGQNGVAPLILERAAEIAVEKARETALGLVRVSNIRGIDSAAAVVAGMATLGPMAGFVLSPGGQWSMALPSPEGLPAVADAGLSAAEEPAKSSRGHRQADSSREQSGRGPASSFEDFVSWVEVLVPDGCWLVVAVSVRDLEPLTTFHERVAAALRRLQDAPGRLLPAAWEARRREVREHGIPIASAAWKPLDHWAQRLAVEVPKPMGH